MFYSGFFFTFLISTGSGQFILSLSRNPVVQSTVSNTGELLAKAVGTITKIPLELADVLGVNYMNLPFLKNERNYVDLSDQFIIDFNSHPDNEDAGLSIVELLIKYGYPVEVHTIETEDGYILTVHRIPNKGPVIFLMHGLLGSSDDFIIAGPESGLAYLLADEGYDVWMGNARGNKHSRHHIRYDPSESIFWDFSWHEIGYYDLPAMIDCALDMSNSSTLKYIGHSQGTTTFFVMASERPEYNKKIALMVALSPVAFMGHIKSPVAKLMAPGVSLIHSVTSSIGLYEFLPDNASMRIFKRLVCGTGYNAEILCNNFLFLFAGFDVAQLNATNLPVLLGHSPSGASMKQFAHFGQNIIARDFKKFNYGVTENFQRYGSATPPNYELQKISTPVSLFYSDADWLAQPDDVDHLYNELSNAIDIYKIPFENFNHLDFLFAKDFKILIYNRLRKLLTFF